LITNDALQEGRFKGLAIGGGFAGHRMRLSVTTAIWILRPSRSRRGTKLDFLSDLNKPLYIPSIVNLDAWISYTTRPADFRPEFARQVSY